MPPKRKASRAANSKKAAQTEHAEVNRDSQKGTDETSQPPKKTKTSLSNLKSEMDSMKNDLQLIKDILIKNKESNSPQDIQSAVDLGLQSGDGELNDCNDSVLKKVKTTEAAEITPPLQADELIQKQISDAAYQITGESANFSHNPSPSSASQFATKSRPLDLHVPSEIKTKIWAHKYIDLSKLVLREDVEDYTYCFQEGSGGETLSIKRVAKKVTLNTVDEWNAAFSIFMYIYCSKYPSAAPALIKYVEHVRKMASRGQDWKYYDKHFRLGQQTEYIPWDYINWEAMSEAQYRTQSFRSSGSSYNRQQSIPTFEDSSVPKGYCHKFHSSEGCSRNPCRYKHTCFFCAGNHSAWFCRQSPSKPLNTKQPPNASHSR